MRITDDTRFPHPVLSEFTGDFTSGQFEVKFIVNEEPKSCALQLRHQVTLTEPELAKLVKDGFASVGCFIRCGDTYFSELRNLSWPSGMSDFAAGKLLNRVTLRPVVYISRAVGNWDSGSIHPEFEPPVSLKKGDLVAIGAEQIISVGQAKLTPIESIFELDSAPDLVEGEIRVDLSNERIKILAGVQTYEMINLLRGQADGAPVVMNSIYLPAIMEVLSSLREGGDSFEDLRWYHPFIAKCDLKGININDCPSTLESAQALLESPMSSLAQILSEGE